MRIFIAAIALGMLSLPQIGHSGEMPRAELSLSGPVKISAADQAAESAAMAKEARDKAEAFERARDRKMKEVSRSICIGC